MARRRWRSTGLVLGLVLVLLAACGGDDASGPALDSTGTIGSSGDGGSGSGSCSAVYDDDMRVAESSRDGAASEVRAAAALGGVAVVCGDGFAQVFDPASGMGAETAISAACTSIASAGSDAVVVGTAAGTVELLTVSGTSLTAAGSAPVGDSVLGVASDGAQAYAATGSGGVVALPLSGGALGMASPFGSVADARGVAVADTGILVAAGTDGVVLLDTAGAVAGTALTDTPALGVRSGGDQAVVLRGAYGWDLVSLGSGPSIDATAETDGVVVDAAISDGEVFTVEGYAVVRSDAVGQRISIERRTGRGELTGGWLRGIAATDAGMVVAEGNTAAALEVSDPADAPDITVDVPSLALWGAPGAVAEALYIVKNEGTADLLIAGVDIASPFASSFESGDEDPSCPGMVRLEPGGTALVTFEVTPADDAPIGETFTIRSNDPDESELQAKIDLNRGAPQLGDAAPDFSALTLDGELFRLSDHDGKVVFLKLFNFGCATCAEEFPVIQSDLIPTYSPTDFIAVGVNTTKRTAYAAGLADDAGLTLPMALDIDAEAFRVYRVPNMVFPLHIVIDRDGRVAHVNNDPGIESIVTAIEAAL